MTHYSQFISTHRSAIQHLRRPDAIVGICNFGRSLPPVSPIQLPASKILHPSYRETPIKFISFLYVANVQREKWIMDAMRRKRIDGLIISLTNDTRAYEHFEQLKRYKIPVVFFDRAPDHADAYCVSCNLEKSSVELVDWLASKGHQQIGFIKGPDTITHSKQRSNGY